MVKVVKRLPATGDKKGQPAPVPEQPVVRCGLALIAAGALAYGFRFGVDNKASGVAVAAALAVGLLLLVVALAGQVPSTLKVGDVEVKLDQARAEGARDGAKLAANAAMGMSYEEIEEAAQQALGSIRDAQSLRRALQAVHSCADVAREVGTAAPDQIDAGKRADLLARLAKA